MNNLNFKMNSGFDEGNILSYPPAFQLQKILLNFSAVSGPIVLSKEKAIDENATGTGYTPFDRYTPRWTDVQIGPIDAIQPDDLFVESNSSYVSFAFYSYQDGSPFMFDGDLPESEKDFFNNNHYSLILLPEYPPFLAHTKYLDHKESESLEHGESMKLGGAKRYLEAIRDSSLPQAYTLNDADCNSLITALSNHESELLEHLDTSANY